MTRASAPYRDEAWLFEQLGEARARYRAGIPEVPAAVQSVLRRRLGRVGAGISGLVGAFAVVALAIGGSVTSADADALLSVALRAAWVAMLVGGVAGWLLAKPLARSHIASVLAVDPRPGELRARLGDLERRSPTLDLARMARRLEKLSVGLPLAAVCLLAPLTLHYLVWLTYQVVWEPVLDAGGGGLLAIDRVFGRWMLVSMVFVGHCHLLLAFLAWRAGEATPRVPSQALASEGLSEGLRALGLVTLVSVLPGVVLCLVPTAVVLCTGLFVPPAFAGLRARVRGERASLAGASPPPLSPA